MSYYRLAALLSFSLTAGAQYNISTLLIDGTPIPGSTNTWNVNAAQIPSTALSISGKYVAFVQCTCNGSTQSTDGVWVLDWTTKTFTQLAAPLDIPSGAGETALMSFAPYALVAGGRVVFLGYTAGGDGFYSVPVGGGAISVIADQTTILPGVGVVGTYALGNSTADLPQSDGKTLAFAASLATGQAAVFTASLNGANLQELAGPNTSLLPDGVCNVNNTGFSTAQPRVYGTNSIFDVPSFFNNFLYAVGPVGTLPPVCILDSSTPLVDGLQFNYASYTAIDSKQVYFEAAPNGLFSESYGGSVPVPILTPEQSVPGIPPPYSMMNGIGAENGTLIFNVTGLSSSGNAESGLYAAVNGGFTRIVGTGDILAGQRGNAWLPPVAPNSISGGRVVFTFGNPEQIGIYLASPARCAEDVTGQLKVTQTPPVFYAPTGDYYSKVTIQNTSSQSIAGPVSAVFNGLVNGLLTYGTPLPELLNTGSGATTCLAPLGEAYLVLNGAAALAPGATTSVVLKIADPGNVPVSFTTRVVSGTPR